MRTSLGIGLAIVLALTLVGGVWASDAPIALTSNTEIGGTLIGDHAGSFALYEIAYPGGEANLHLRLWYAPSDPVTSKVFGFKVYGANGFKGQGEPNEEGYVGVLDFWYSNENATTLLVQVYNYLDGATVSYGIIAEGLPEAVQATPVATPAAPVAQPAQPEAVATVETSLSGSSMGNTGGGVSLHTFNYPGDEADTTVTMHFAPTDPSFGKAFGFIVYDPMGKAVATGEVTGTAGERTATFASAVSGTYVIQVYNYADGVLMSYTLALSR
jgi:hypothetical protein